MRDFIQYFLWCVECFFILYMLGYASFLFLSVTVGSSDLYAAKRRNLLKNELSNDYYLPVSIVVPAHNEGVTIEATIRSLLALDYKLYEIIVVDDGSTDGTAQTVRESFRMWPVSRPIQRRIPCQPAQAIYESRAWKVPITLVCKQNGGKADALNMGINVSNYPYFLCMDADSVLQHDSLEKIVRPVLEDPSVIAVGGTVRPCNGAEIQNGRVVRYRMPKKLLAAMQVLEYDRSFLASRILFDKFNGSIIISGAFGLYQKNLVIAAGGYDRTTMVGRYGSGGQAPRLLPGAWQALPDALCHRRRVLDPSARKPGRSVQTAETLAHRLVPEHEKAPKHFGKPQIRGRQFCLLPLFFDL